MMAGIFGIILIFMAGALTVPLVLPSLDPPHRTCVPLFIVAVMMGFGVWLVW